MNTQEKYYYKEQKNPRLNEIKKRYLFPTAYQLLQGIKNEYLNYNF
jgi:hypothetical protein